MINWIKRKLGITQLEQERTAVMAERDQLQKEQLTLFEQRNHLLEENKKQLEDLEVLRKQDAKDKEKHDSDVPWIEIVSDGYDDKKGISIGLDWNAAFIDCLKTAGVTGSTDEEFIRKYLAFLYDDIITRFAQEEIDAKERKGSISDFE